MKCLIFLKSILINSIPHRMTEAEEEQREWDEEELKERESVIMDIGKKFKEDGKAQELENMIKSIRPFTKLLSKAKAAKLIRGLVGFLYFLPIVYYNLLSPDRLTCTWTWRPVSAASGRTTP